MDVSRSQVSPAQVDGSARVSHVKQLARAKESGASGHYALARSVGHHTDLSRLQQSLKEPRVTYCMA